MNRKIYLSILGVITLLLSWTAAEAQYTITSEQLDNNCPYLFAYINTNYSYNNAGTFYLKQYWGDGTEDIQTLDSSLAYFSHSYNTIGVYTVKTVLTSSNGTPIDSFTQAYNNVNCSGYVLTLFNDENSNCAYDAGTDYILYNTGATVQVDSAGVSVGSFPFLGAMYYAETGPVGTVYTYTLTNLPAGYTACGTTVRTNTLTNNNTYIYDYVGFNCAANNFDLAFYGWFSPGLTGAGTHTYVTNYGCNPQAATLTVNFSPKYSYSTNYGGYPATVSGNSVTFDLGVISQNQTVNLVAIFTPNGTLTLGDTVHATWTVDPIAGDVNPANNVFSQIDTIHSSWDPNEMAVTPQGFIDAGTSLQYMTGFENTGNDTAKNIHIMDTLSANVDVTSLKIVSSSNAVTEEFLKDGSGHTVIKFDFPNINLLDSSHHNKCNGSVVYTINAKTGLAAGTTIDNRAGIYFDANAVVMTNTVENVIGHPTSVNILRNSSVQIYPNPVADELNITTTGGYSSLQIVNTLGEVIMTQPVTNAQTTVNVHQLAAGIYYVSLRGDSGVKVEKFEKL